MPRKPKPSQPEYSRSQICTELVALQRMRRDTIAMRVMQANGLTARVATDLGYGTGLDEAARTKMFNEARTLIKSVMEGVEHRLGDFIRAAMIGIESLESHQRTIEKEMMRWMKMLPVYEWVQRPCMRGIGHMHVATIIGEAGDLDNYAGPAKLWKRMGCAPHSFDGQTQMGATWKSGKNGKLPAAEWEAFGYNPRRRSITYLIGEGIVKQNGTVGAGGTHRDAGCAFVGPYRAHYNHAKEVSAANHPDWTPAHCHKHAMLLATKLFLKHLWCFWNDREVVVPQHKTLELVEV